MRKVRLIVNWIHRSGGSRDENEGNAAQGPFGNSACVPIVFGSADGFFWRMVRIIGPAARRHQRVLPLSGFFIGPANI